MATKVLVVKSSDLLVLLLQAAVDGGLDLGIDPASFDGYQLVRAELRPSTQSIAFVTAKASKEQTPYLRAADTIVATITTKKGMAQDGEDSPQTKTRDTEVSSE